MTNLARKCALLLAALLAACSSQPPTPDWQMTAHSAVERFQAAWLAGDTRLAKLEFTQARAAIASSGELELMARLELIRCATQVASLDFEACSSFQAVRQDVSAAQLAYWAYLDGHAGMADLALLPQSQRAPASASTDAAAIGALQAIDDPLSRLVAAGVLLRSGRASPALLTIAVDTASSQGWRRPLLAWLGVQARVAEQAGAMAEAQRIRRRIALVQSSSWVR